MIVGGLGNFLRPNGPSLHKTFCNSFPLPSDWMSSLAPKNPFTSPTAQEGGRVFETLLDLPLAREVKSAGVSESVPSGTKSIRRITRPSEAPTAHTMFSRAKTARLLPRLPVSRRHQLHSDLADVIPEGRGGLRAWLALPHEDPWKFTANCGDR